jgi:hypothetical protein
MLANHPAVRQGLYYATLVISCLIIIFKYLHTGWAADMANAGQELDIYLAGLVGLTAGQNVNTSAPAALPPLGGDFPGR